MTKSLARVLSMPGFRKCALLLLFGAVLVAPARAVRAVSCGATVLADLTLDQDLTCSGAGLVVGADDIEIDLNGYSISGSGTGTGIRVSGRANVSIRGGTLANFLTGVFVTNSTGISIKGNTFQNNTDGIDLQTGSTFVTVKENAFFNNRTRGVMMRGGTADITVKENQFAGNRVGVLVNGPIRSVVKENIIETSGLAGIRVGDVATGNLVVENLIASNPSGIDFLVGTGGASAVGNTFKENTIVSNGCGVSGPSGGNTFKENVFTGNATDICS
jgi:parallel beta-helix repeat protein